MMSNPSGSFVHRRLQGKRELYREKGPKKIEKEHVRLRRKFRSYYY